MTTEPTYEAAKTYAFARLAEVLTDSTDGARLRPLAREALRHFARREGATPWLPPSEHTRDLVRAALAADDAELFRELVEAYALIEYHHWDLQRAWGVSREDRGPVPTAARVLPWVRGHAKLDEWTRASPEHPRKLDAWCAAIERAEAAALQG